jgi:hypothetical protein
MMTKYIPPNAHGDWHDRPIQDRRRDNRAADLVLSLLVLVAIVVLLIGVSHG